MIRAGLVEWVLVLAVVVIVPVGARVHPDVDRRWSLALLVAAVPATVALLAARGIAAGTATLPWTLVAVVFALAALRRWLADPVLDSPALAWPVASAYLVVGAAWLAADRFGVAAVGVAPPFVELTAVHFHYAGFGAATLAARAWCHVRGSDRLAATATWLVLASPPLVALGFTWWGALQVVGAVLLTAGLWLLAWVVGWRVVPSLPSIRPAPRRLLVVSAVSVLAPMALAVHWAAGTNLGFRVLSIPDMAVLHGVVNAVGFTLAGLVGWRLVGPVRE